MIERLNWRWLGILVALLLAGWCAWSWGRWTHQANMAAGFAARVVCSCRHVEGRAMESCRGDLHGSPGMGMIILTDDARRRIVYATAPLLARRSARAVTGFGCLIDPE